eukprot:CAMPEP_0114584742 /NCGR_PEP_ID=MMETSP0125-20121206/8395_1 /TAXON_ID=485358 ORGANISM="Aristerostoma sp., Strain ATCC 50986" /NCGR_SAMPLE_ID=MMETSP0125 /ASSEMBLY_ACC=CAM_ASM_000245 /LENGTH=85 /DNA_ID=CAMNT_0001779343 /DNA_START=108 /DNA_END=362 /DNA_ORIENTATION=+
MGKIISDVTNVEKLGVVTSDVTNVMSDLSDLISNIANLVSDITNLINSMTDLVKGIIKAEESNSLSSGDLTSNINDSSNIIGNLT